MIRPRRRYLLCGRVGEDVNVLAGRAGESSEGYSHAARPEGLNVHVIYKSSMRCGPPLPTVRRILSPLSTPLNWEMLSIAG